METMPMHSRKKTLRHPPIKPFTERWRRELRKAIGEDYKGNLVGQGDFITGLNALLQRDGYLPITANAVYKALKPGSPTKACSFVDHASELHNIEPPTLEEIRQEEAAPTRVKASRVGPNPLAVIEVEEDYKDEVLQYLEFLRQRGH